MRLHNLRSAGVCLMDLSAGGGCMFGCVNGELGDGTAGIVRLGDPTDDAGFGPTIAFDLGDDLGCTGSSTPSAGTPFERLEFLLDTSDSGPLDASDQLVADVFGTPDESTPVAHVELHPSTTFGFPIDSEFRVVSDVLDPPLMLSDIDHVELRLGADDLWPASGIVVYGLATDPSAQTCVAMYPGSNTFSAGEDDSTVFAVLGPSFHPAPIARTGCP